MTARREEPAPGREFPSAWEDWHRRRLAAERCFVPWIEQVRPLADCTMLEYGCGNGPVTATFAPRAARYLGIDIDESAIETGRRILAEGGVHPELHVASPSEILDATREVAGEGVDVFLCYAVLEHMSVEERLALLRLAREVVKPDGIIVIIETPNRLTPWDYHTSQLPFLNQLPEDLALAYLDRSPRAEFVQAMQEAKANGPETAREALVRWGRGMSYHELELVFGDLSRHVVASSWDPVLLPEREIYRAELALQRVLDGARPDLAPAFSRYWLDLILTAEPLTDPARFLRPWPLRTVGSRGAAYDETILLDGVDAVLFVDLPVRSSRLVVHADGEIVVSQPATGEEQPADAVFQRPAERYAIRGTGVISAVLYEG